MYHLHPLFFTYVRHGQTVFPVSCLFLSFIFYYYYILGVAPHCVNTLTMTKLPCPLWFITARGAGGPGAGGRDD